MKKLCLVLSACCLVLEALAVPVGVRLAMHGRAAAVQTADAIFPRLPWAASSEKVAEKLAVATDTALAANITDAADYADFRAWAASVGAASVKASETAWLSYALGAAGIVPAPQEGDLAIDTLAIGLGGNVEAVFSLDGVSIGSSALESRLKTIFGVEGAATCEESRFSPDGVALTLAPTGDGRVKATVTPPAAAKDSFFLRVKMK